MRVDSTRNTLVPLYLLLYPSYPSLLKTVQTLSRVVETQAPVLLAPARPDLNSFGLLGSVFDGLEEELTLKCFSL